MWLDLNDHICSPFQDHHLPEVKILNSWSPTLSMKGSHTDHAFIIPRGSDSLGWGWEDVSLGQTHLGESSTVHDNLQAKLSLLISSKYLLTNYPTTKLLRKKTRLGKCFRAILGRWGYFPVSWMSSAHQDVKLLASSISRAHPCYGD